MKALIVLALFAGCALADSVGACPPVMTPDSQAVTNDCPGLGSFAYAYRGTSGRAWANDNIGRGDWDFNDAVVDFSVSNLGYVTVWWYGSDSAWPDSISLDGHTISQANPTPFTVGMFGEGEVLDFLVNTPYGSYHSGPGDLNSDDTIHFLIQQDPPAPTPEPATAVLIGIGFLGFVSKRRISNGN